MNDVILPAAIALVVWTWLISPLMYRLKFTERGQRGFGGFTVGGVWKFCRPHTVKGTLLATISGYSLLSVYHERSAVSALLQVLVSGVLANIFIVGINQLVDVEIDITNGKGLPIATGELSWKAGYWITSVSLMGSILVSFGQSFVWGCVISCMCTIGVLYSVPPFRLKRFAVPAALCIVTARALLATVGGAYTLSEAMERPLDEFAIFHLKVFTSVLIVFTTVIALMKDIPDMEGDLKEGVRSLSLLLGPETVSSLCFNLIVCIYTFLIPVTSYSSPECLITHGYGLLFLLMRWRRTDQDHKEVAMANYFEVVWPLFYYEFFAYLAPLALEQVQPHVTVEPKYFGALFGMEAAYLLSCRATATAGDESNNQTRLVASIKESSGLNLSDLYQNLRLSGLDPTRAFAGNNDSTAPLINEAAAEMSVALNMHSKLTRLPVGKRFKNAKNLSILAGDWLLARAVMTLCSTKNHAVIQEMAKAIVHSCQENDETRISQIIKIHSKNAAALLLQKNLLNKPSVF